MTGIIASLPPLVEQPPGNNSSDPAGLPGVSYTVAVLNLPQTWTALQTFPAGMISIHSSDIVGINVAPVASRWIDSIVVGVPHLSQPAFTDISGQATLAQLPTLGASTVLGSIAGGTPIALTTAQHTTLVNAFTSLLSGAVPASGGGTTTFLRADGAFAVPGAASGVTSVNGQTGAVVSYFTPQGRLTLTSVTPVMTTSVAGATTVYYTPYAGNMVPIYDGTNMVPTVVAEVSQATTDTTKSPAAVAASKVYDIFVWNDAGTIRATRGPAWTNDTTRGYTLTMTNGIMLNTSIITNGPAALRGTWVGTVRSNSSSLYDYIFGASGAGGVAAFFGVWNTYNRVNVNTMIQDSTGSWNYAVATTWRAANASATARVTYVCGSIEDGISATYYALAAPGAATIASCGIGVDSTTSPSQVSGFWNGSTPGSIPASYNGYPGLGVHVLSAIEFISTSTSSSFYGASTAYAATGLSVTLRL